MDLIDTPNPNAKKVVIDLSELGEEELGDNLSSELSKIQGVSSIFLGPGFITVTKEENTEWDSINQDIINIFDKL
tara:strand:- start:609 stop:833 length:225 start_codon:yes stop_codon:yes gene_type:complete